MTSRMTSRVDRRESSALTRLRPRQGKVTPGTSEPGQARHPLIADVALVPNVYFLMLGFSHDFSM